MNKRLVGLLPIIALFVTGCPRNEYEVELKPHGNKIKRTLVFYRADGQDSNGVPKYEGFPAEELDAITAVYPKGGVMAKGNVYTAKGEFTAAMPMDVGGSGTYTNLITTMGTAGFYAERFRGNDDLAGQAEKRLAAANQLTDLVLSWSEMELGRETNYAALRKFLDTDFRNDLKNATFYWRQANMDNMPKTTNAWDYGVRFVYYLMERDYFKLADTPGLFLAEGDDHDDRLMEFVQRLVARKLGVSDTQPIPESLAFLHNSDAMEKSFSNYFTGTPLYRAKLAEWREENKNSAEKPDVAEIIAGQLNTLFELNLFGDPLDHLTVRLALPVRPTHSNGEWNETSQQTVWNSDLESKTNSTHLPVFCYASWAQPVKEFQNQHFGRVMLIGDDLIEYCIWHATLTGKQRAEWEKLVTSLQPGDTLRPKIKDFRFSDEPPTLEKKGEEKSPSYVGRSSLENALDGKSLQGGPSDASKLN